MKDRNKKVESHEIYQLGLRARKYLEIERSCDFCCGLGWSSVAASWAAESISRAHAKSATHVVTTESSLSGATETSLVTTKAHLVLVSTTKSSLVTSCWTTETTLVVATETAHAHVATAKASLSATTETAHAHVATSKSSLVSASKAPLVSSKATLSVSTEWIIGAHTESATHVTTTESSLGGTTETALVSSKATLSASTEAHLCSSAESSLVVTTKANLSADTKTSCIESALIASVWSTRSEIASHINVHSNGSPSTYCLELLPLKRIFY